MSEIRRLAARRVCVCLHVWYVCIWCVFAMCLLWCNMLRDGANTACQSRLSGRHQTQIFASPPVRTTANTNFRISACHGYPMGRLHNQLASRRPRAQQLLQKALCTAPATRTPAAGQAATTCAAAPPADPVYCACHTNASRGPAGDHARSSSSRRLCITRLPHESQPRATRASRRPRARQLLQTALYTAPATRKPAAAQRRPRAQQLRQEALCTAPATRQRGVIDKWCDE